LEVQLGTEPHFSHIVLFNEIILNITELQNAVSPSDSRQDF